MKRADGRLRTEARPPGAELNFIAYPEGSVLFSLGNTRVLCNASIEQRLPGWMQSGDKPGGWVTAEYAMLPRATHSRSQRETFQPRARSQEIRRLIGRSLRAAVKLENLPAITCIVDCDVLQADGGTRTASISGGYIALAMALFRLSESHGTGLDLFRPAVAAISAGIVDDEAMVDLAYREDASAAFDLNVVMNASGALIEVQGTAEQGAIPRDKFVELLELTETSIRGMLQFQRDKLQEADISLPEEVWGAPHR
ncbi:MAG: ribonuclease PH [Anaerolineales bacterium]|nr:ribonuclease PH [Anaerolineales bacterium]